MAFPLNSGSGLAYDGMINSIQQMFNVLVEQVPPGLLSPSQIQILTNDLPRLDEKKLTELNERDSSCPICFSPYLTILAEEETALAMDSPAHPVEELGVTKLSQPWQCGHMFCRRDISKWINEGHDSCPLCRRFLLEEQSEEARTARAQAQAAQYSEAQASLLRHSTQLQERFSAQGIDFLGDILTHYTAAATQPVHSTNNEETPASDDRNEFSSMYS